MRYLIAKIARMSIVNIRNGEMKNNNTYTSVSDVTKDSSGVISYKVKSPSSATMWTMLYVTIKVVPAKCFSDSDREW